MAYSILSLDGGGSWSLIQVRILQKKYGDNAKGHDILKKYDMVIANSGGSLVLAAMCINKQLDEILEMFLDEDVLKSIFVENLGDEIIPGYNKLPLPRFKTKEKLIGLSKQLGHDADKQLTEFPKIIGKSNLQIIITGFDYDKERAVYFRSNPLSKMETGIIQNEVCPGSQTDTFKSVSLLHAVHASSNAPVLFFDNPAEFPYYIPSLSTETKNRRFWDGAIGGNNNPITSGLLEAIANGAKPEEIRIVTIGTANVVQPILYGEPGEPHYDEEWLVKIGRDERIFSDIKKMSSAIICDPPDAATFITHHILGLPYEQTNSRLIRINPMIKPIYNSIINKWEKPGANWDEDDLKKLFKMEMAVTNEDDVRLINRMTDEYFQGRFQNQGVRLGGKALEPILGHKDFHTAFKDWESWDEEADGRLQMADGRWQNLDRRK